MKAQFFILFSCSLFISFIFGIVYRHYFNSLGITECECYTDENVLKYQQWLEESNTLDHLASNQGGSISMPKLLSFAREQTVTPVTVTDNTLPAQQFDPSPSELHWTTVNDTGTTVFSAYYNTNTQLSKVPSILILGYQSKKHRDASLHCFFKYSDGSTECSQRKSVVLEMDSCDKQKEYVKKKEREYLHVFHVCLLRNITSEIPTHVALSHNHMCTPSSQFIPIFQKWPTQKVDFGVCVETPAFKKSLSELVNYIEIYRLLGAQRITLYSLELEESTVDYLSKTYPNTLLQVIKWTTTLHEKEPIHYYGEILAIQDCLYRNMYSVKYLAFVDLDELLVPRRYKDWGEMMREIDQPYIDSFVFMNSIYMKTSNINERAITSDLAQCKENAIVPKYFTHYDRSTCIYHYNSRSKIIVKPSLVFDISIHTVCTRFSNTTHYYVPSSSGLSHHYRAMPTIECRKNRRTRKYDTEHDKWMMRYISSLYARTNRIICHHDNDNTTMRPHPQNLDSYSSSTGNL